MHINDATLVNINPQLSISLQGAQLSVWSNRGEADQIEGSQVQHREVWTRQACHPSQTNSSIWVRKFSSLGENIEVDSHAEKIFCYICYISIRKQNQVAKKIEIPGPRVKYLPGEFSTKSQEDFSKICF